MVVISSIFFIAFYKVCIFNFVMITDQVITQKNMFACFDSLKNDKGEEKDTERKIIYHFRPKYV